MTTNKDFQMWNIYHNYLKENKISYQEYVLSPHWLDFKLKYYRFRKRNWRCDACLSDSQIAIHHKSYERMGKEKFSDLCLLCENCHNKVHSIYKKSKDRYTLREVTNKFISDKRKSKGIKRLSKFLHSLTKIEKESSVRVPYFVRCSPVVFVDKTRDLDNIDNDYSTDQCSFLKKNGQRCKSKKQRGYKYCGVHLNPIK